MAKLFRQKSSISGLVTDLLNINTAISNEVTRATDEEIRIEGLITAEGSRAQAAEALVQSNLNAEVTRATAAEGVLTANLASEVTRATAAEGVLTANLASEVTRATTAEGVLTANLASEVTRATTAEGVLQDNIDAEESRAIAAESTLQSNINAVESLVEALGNAFNYVSAVTAGIDEANAFDMESLPANGKDAGDYYKVTTAGWVKVGQEAPFYVNINDGLVWNTLGAVDKIDNTDSVVFGTPEFIDVQGSTDTGFYVDVHESFKARMSEAENAIVAEVTRATVAEGVLQDNIDVEVTRATTAEALVQSNLDAEESRAIAAEGVLQDNIDAEESRAIAAEATKLAIASNLSDLADIAVARSNLNVYSKAEVDSAIAGQSNKTKNDTAVIASGKITFSVAPVGGVDGIAFGIIRIFGVDGTNPMAYDEVQVSLDGADATGKTFLVSSDISGEYDGKSASAFISYNPAA